MTKLLNARDLLENVRSADQESSQDTAGGEVVPTAGGRVFLGTFKPRANAAAALGSRSAAVKATAARSAAVRDAAQRSSMSRPTPSSVPEIGVSLPDVTPLEAQPRTTAAPSPRPVAPAPAPAALSSAPAASPPPPPNAAAPAAPPPGWAPVGRKHTVPLEAVRPEAAAKPAAQARAASREPVEPAIEKDLEAYVRSEEHDAHGDSRTIEMALPPELAASAPDFDDSRTLELALPNAAAHTQAIPPSAHPTVAKTEVAPAPRSISPSQPLRKAGTSSWSRSTDTSPGSEPTSPRGTSVGRPSIPSTPPSNLAADEPPLTPAAPASVPATSVPSTSAPGSSPGSAPQGAPRPKSAVADMFSWVTQKPAWAPESSSLQEVAPLDAPASASTSAQVVGQTPVVQPSTPVKSESVARPIEARGAPPPSFVADVGPASTDEPVALSSEETLIMLSYDETIPLRELADSTGLTEWRVSLIVDRLKKRGVLESDEASAPTVPAGVQAPALPPPSAEAKPSLAAPEPTPTKPAPPSPTGSSPVALGPAAAVAALGATSRSVPTPSTVDATHSLDAPESKAPATMPSGAALVELGGLPLAVDAAAPLDDVAAPSARVEPAPASRPAQAPLTPAEDSTPAPTAASSDDTTELDDADALVEDEESEASEAPEGTKEPADPASMLALFELKLSILPSDERAKLAQTTDGDELYALAYDKDPAVVRAAWDNIHISVEHARFWAFHHRTSMGLERIGQRVELLKDPQTQRRLFRNPQVSEPLLRKILLSKRLIDIYKHTLDREASERTRQSARGLLRNKFSTTEPEDRVQLLWNTEGRALQQLSGLSLDSKTASLVCARPIVSMMLVQSFLRFSATPPSIISYLLKQPLVKRQIHLRNALLKHPNCPADAKRAF
jgi:hypothetical protein